MVKKDLSPFEEMLYRRNHPYREFFEKFTNLIKKYWSETLLGVVMVAILYYGWDKSLFFIPDDWIQTGGDGEAGGKVKDYLALVFSVGSVSLLFWAYYKSDRIIQKFRKNYFNLQYHHNIEHRVFELNSDLHEKILESLSGSYQPGKDVVYAVLLERGRPLGINFEDPRTADYKIDEYIKTVNEYKNQFDKVLIGKAINLYSRDIYYIIFNFLDELLESNKMSEYLIVDEVFEYLSKDSMPIIKLYKRVCNLIYSSNEYEKWLGKYKPQEESFNLEELIQFLKEHKTKEYYSNSNTRRHWFNS